MTVMISAIQADFTAALGGGSVAITNLTPRVPEITSIPNVGCNIEFSVSGSSLTEVEVTAALTQSKLTFTDLIFNADFTYPLGVQLLKTMPESVSIVLTSTNALTGSSFYWSAVMNSSVNISLALAAMEMDMQVAVDAEQSKSLVSVLVSTVMVNTSSMYVDYTVYGLTETNTNPFLVLELASTASLNSFSTYMEDAMAAQNGTFLDELQGLLPRPVAFRVAPYPDPNPATDPTTNIVRRESERFVLYFSGYEAGWRGALAEYNTLVERITADSNAAIVRLLFVNTASVLSVRHTYSKAKKLNMLVAKITVEQASTIMASMPWTGEQMAAILAIGNYDSTLAQFQPVTLEDKASLLSATIDADYGFACTNLCAASILMGSASIFFLVITAICTAIAVCCYCSLTRPEKEAVKTSDEFILKLAHYEVNPLIAETGQLNTAPGRVVYQDIPPIENARLQIMPPEYSEDKENALVVPDSSH